MGRACVLLIEGAAERVCLSWAEHVFCWLRTQRSGCAYHGPSMCSARCGRSRAGVLIMGQACVLLVADAAERVCLSWAKHVFCWLRTCFSWASVSSCGRSGAGVPCHEITRRRYAERCDGSHYPDGFPSVGINIAILLNQYHLQPKTVVGDQAFMTESWELF